MPIEYDDLGLRVVGTGVKGLKFYDDARTLQAEIYLQADGTLNIGGESGGGGAAGGDGAPADAQYLVLSAHDGLENERVIAAGGGLAQTDGGPGNNYTLAVDWGTPTIGTIEPDDAADAGTGTNPARSDHQHAIVAAAAGTIEPDDAADEGEAASFARSDHQHAIVTATPVDTSTANAEGNATSFARSNHVHKLHDHDHTGDAGDGGQISHDTALTNVSANDHHNEDHKDRHDPADGADPLDTAVAGTIEPDDAASEGAAHSFARSDHQHAIVAAAPTVNMSVASANAEGDAVSFARSNHAHAVTTSSNPGAAAAILATDANGRLQIQGLGIGAAPTAQEGRIDGDLVFVGPQSITSTAGNVTLAPAGDLTLDPTGNDVLPGTNYDINLGALAKKYLTLHAAELWVETLVAQDTIATIGGRILVGPTTVLTSDLGDGAGDTTITVKHNEMANGDRVYLEADGKVEFMSIDGAPGGGGPYTYAVTRNLDGSGRNAWYAGDAVFNTGAVGEGFIDLYSVHGVKAGIEYGPTIVGNVRDSATYNDWSEHWAIGQLNGIYGYGAATWGVALGEYAAGQPHLTIDSTNGIQIFDGLATVIGQWDTSGNILVGQTGAGQSNVLITAGAVQLRNDTTPKITLSASGAVIIDQFGDAFFSAADGLLLLGPGCEITPTSWTSLRKQMATLSGAFRQPAGRWAGTKGLAVEPAGTNLVVNPSFEVNITDGWAAPVGIDTVERSTTYSRFGSASMRLYELAAEGAAENIGCDEIAVAADTAYTASAWIKKTIATGTGRLQINWFTAAHGNISSASIVFTTGIHDWKRYIKVATSPATAAFARVYVTFAGITATTEAEIFADGIQFEATGCATSYIDGTLGTGYAWTGVAHNSTSTRTRTEVNLEACVGLVSGNDTVSFVTWVQMPYDYDATWPSGYSRVFDLIGAGTTALSILYHEANQLFYLNLNDGVASTVIWAGAQTFSAGDWLQIICTLDYASDEYNLYVNGVHQNESTTALDSAALTAWNVGTTNTGGGVAGFAFSEYAVFDRVLTAAEVAAMYALSKPLTDMGSLDAPGLYILDGRVKIASSTTGARFEIDADQIVGRDAAGDAQVTIDAATGLLTAINANISGTIVIGNPGDIDTSTLNNDAVWTDDTAANAAQGDATQALADASAANAHRVLGVTGTWTPTDLNTITWTNVHLFIGDGTDITIVNGNTGNMAARTYIYYNGTTTLQLTADPDDIGGTHTLVAVAQNGAVKASINVVGGATYISGDWINTGTITATEITGATLSAIYADMGVLTAGEIRMYAGTWDGDATGFRITADEIAGQNAGTDQVVIAAATGKLTAGGGKVKLDADGISITGGSVAFTAYEAYKLYASDGSTLWGYFGSLDAVGGHELYVRAENVAGETSLLVLDSQTPAGSTATAILRANEAATAQVQITLSTNNEYIYLEGGHVYCNRDLRVAEGGYFGAIDVAPDVGWIYATKGAYINETSNAFQTLGLTINQGAADDEAMALKSSDVAHGMTDDTETDTYGTIKKLEATSGGLSLNGYKDADGVAGYAANLSGYLGEAADTGKAAGSAGVVQLYAAVKAGTTYEAVGADGNLVVIRTIGATKFIFDVEGSAHALLEWTTFDEEDDVAVLGSLEETMMAWCDPVKAEFGDFLTDKRAQLEELGIVHFDADNPGHAMVNTTRLSMLLVGAIRQMGGRLGALELAS